MGRRHFKLEQTIHMLQEAENKLARSIGNSRPLFRAVSRDYPSPNPRSRRASALAAETVEIVRVPGPETRLLRPPNLPATDRNTARSMARDRGKPNPPVGRRVSVRGDV